MLIIRKEAEEDIKTTYEWYEEQRINLGVAFVEEVESKLEEIEEHPDLYMKIISDVRRALCKRFPYSIYFIHKNTDVIVIAVLHQRRSPAVWQVRKNAEQGA
ncbi:MAG: type II toxin-antitoxin system RelE/ParE family toxin [Gammaproteobacteria bacterium]|nr:type II toxin-antitoxin system RelE/ParE family toxin [Gammaproteobacteria bacterium]